MTTPRLRRTVTSPLAAILAVLMALTLAFALGALPARAQGLFSPVLFVNDEPITNYQINQKLRFLHFIGTTSADRNLAIERLIEDRLQVQEVQRLGGRLGPTELDAGMAEFASRADLTTEEFLRRMQAEGIDRETFVEFIRAGILWRSLIRTEFGDRVLITDAEIDRALSVEGVQPTTEVLISELFLPADPQYADAVQNLIPRVQAIRTEAEFANAARQVSAAPSAAQGGRVNRWINVAAMPPEVSGTMSNAAIGTVVGPIDVPGAYAFFQLRARRTGRSVPAEAIELEYMRAGLPGGRSEANMAAVAQLREQIDSCVDFPGEVLRALPSLPESAVNAITRSQSALDSATRAELERLNPGQISANLVESSELVVLMLCARRIGAAAAPPREEVRMSLLNRALEGQALVYLQRLRAEADIRYP